MSIFTFNAYSSLTYLRVHVVRQDLVVLAVDDARHAQTQVDIVRQGLVVLVAVDV
jgi:hypothetical protein